MKNPRELAIKDFWYELPDESIARYPLPERDASKLLIYKEGKISEDTYRQIHDYIPERSVLVFNNTKVIRARLYFFNSTGARIEIFCLEPAGQFTEVSAAMTTTATAQWVCMIGGLAKWKEDWIEHRTKDLVVSVRRVEKTGDSFVLEFKWEPAHLSFAEVLDKVGEMPIPPYLKRNSEEVDTSRYQTILATHEGSVAAPTAALHFTPDIIKKLRAQQVDIQQVTLHVGAGTFKPVKSEVMQGHHMHTEFIQADIEVVHSFAWNERTSALYSPDKTIAVGTTALRTLESLYWMGIKAMLNPMADIGELEISQWDVYDPQLTQFDVDDKSIAWRALYDWMKERNMKQLICKTQILIAPPYKLKVADALITNFHQPGSTLLLLVAAVVGDKWKEIYGYAVKSNFRFLSYGDGSLLFAE